MRRVSSLFSLAPLALLTLAGCAADPPPPAPPPVAPAPVSTVVAPTSPPPVAREDGRLPALATAERYDLSLFIDPNQPRFSGAVRILVKLPAATQYVVLNGRGLHVTHAAAQVGNDTVGASVSERASHGGKVPEELVLTFERPLPATTPSVQTVLELTYDAPFDDSLAGIYRVSEGGRWYAFSQFEATDARRAFPCFDEPSQKVPFDVHITAPKGLLAFSNMPESGHADGAASTSTPTTTTDFKTSPPLPTYLVAVAVGDFDVKEGQAKPFPIRIITTKGKSAMGGMALDDTAALVGELSSYFGVAYPYPKLDIVAVPNFAAGAMENAGLITFREELLLLDPAHAPQRARIAEAEVIAHELAHQWFGDLVTTGWWDDLWLNEGFATWAEAKIVELWRPAYHAHLERVAGLGGVMSTDSLKSARAVRQPVHSTSEAMEAFDGITYDKGAAVLGMLEHMVGSDVFRRGIEQYLRDNAWKTATADDLLHALDKVSGKDVSKVAATFLNRPGVPNVTLATDCAAKPPTLTLSQEPWHLLGESSDKGAAPWIIPTDVRASNEELRIMLPDAHDAVPTPRCPGWVDPNVGGYGYYRYSLDEKRWAAFASVVAKQSDVTRLVFLDNLWGQVEAGTLGADVALRTLPVFDTETSRVVVDAEIDVLFQMAHELVSPEAAPAFARYVSARLVPHRQALDAAKAKAKAGTAPTEDEVLERRAIFTALGQLANDPATLTEANKLTVAWLADPTSVDGDLARVAVTLGSRKAGADRIDALRAAMKAAKNPNDKKTALLGLAGFDDPATLGKGLEVALTDDVRTQDVGVLLWNAVYHPASEAAATEWAIAHWDGIRAKLPGFLVGRVFGIASRACTKTEIDRATSFFMPKAKDVEGAQRPLEEALESASLCQALRDKDGSSVDRFFNVKVGGGATPKGAKAKP
jgi:alanyl aminopeptidase